MTFTIALSGKGGSGKTTLAALIIRYITTVIGKAVLAVDADPNSNLGAVLGVQVDQDIADIREDVRSDKVDLPAGMTKERHLEYLIQQRIEECDGAGVTDVA